MQDVYRNGQFEEDQWQLTDVETDDSIVDSIIWTKSQLIGDPSLLSRTETNHGLLIEAGDHLDDVADLLPNLALVAVNFPKFNDGRGFSIARLLRERYGYTGPLRAVGDVLLDLIPHMERVGFTEFTVTNEPTRRALKARQLPEMPVFYQPAWSGETQEAPVPAGRPWLRRAV